MDEKEINILGKDQNYWWFKAKEEFIRTTINDGYRVLNVGAGVFDYEGAENWRGDLRDGLPYENEVYDYIILADVLEHIPPTEREGALFEIYRVLNDDGKLIITVPAYNWLYSKHDEFLNHYNRYSKRLLKNELWMFTPIKLRYWNSILFPFCVIRKLLNKTGSDFKKLPIWLNNILYKILKLEEKLWFPFGITIVGVFKK